MTVKELEKELTEKIPQKFDVVPIETIRDIVGGIEFIKPAKLIVDFEGLKFTINAEPGINYTTALRQGILDALKDPKTDPLVKEKWSDNDFLTAALHSVTLRYQVEAVYQDTVQ